MDEGKAEIYKYVRDQHDKHVAARESLISRFGNVRLLAALLLTVFSFSISVVAKSIENAQGVCARVIAILPLVSFAVALYHITRALLAVPDLVGTIYFNIPGADEKTILKAFKDEEPNADEILEDLSSNYLEAINHNISANENAGENLKKCAHFIRRALFATITFLALTIFSNLAVAWLPPKK